MPVLKVRYFNGTSDDFAAIYTEVEAWLKETGVTKYQLSSTPHFASGRWQILITIMYQEGAGPVRSSIIKPTLMPSRVN